jgi:hypothetical protein
VTSVTHLLNDTAREDRDPVAPALALACSTQQQRPKEES